jgi:hypothetical protein
VRRRGGIRAISEAVTRRRRSARRGSP